MNVQKSYKHIWPKKVKYPIPKIPDDSEKNRVRIGYCQKISGRVGYRVPVRPCLQPPKMIAQNPKSEQWWKVSRPNQRMKVSGKMGSSCEDSKPSCHPHDGRSTHKKSKQIRKHSSKDNINIDRKFLWGLLHDWFWFDFYQTAFKFKVNFWQLAIWAK